MGLKNQLRARRAKEQKPRKHRDLLVESVRTHLLPVLIARGFEVRAPRVHRGPVDRDFDLNFPSWGRLIRVRETGTDLVEIQFSSYRRAAFRINACVVPKDGMMTLGGHSSVEELEAGGLHDHFGTHARPWLRTGLRVLGLEPLGAWFSLGFRWFRSPVRADYDKLALRVAGFVPELDLALREGKLGPHMLRIVFSGKVRGGHLRHS